MQNPAVIELQILCQDENKTVTQLLRNALVIATKLGLHDFTLWCKNELNGYTDDVPTYRIIKTDLYALNIGTRKFLPVRFSQDIFETLKIKILNHSINELIDWVEKGNENYVLVKIDEELEKICLQLFEDTIINQYNNMGINTTQYLSSYEPILVISKSQLINIFSKVRQIILQWSLELEQQGILGEGLIFTAEEKQVAHNNPNIHIGNFQGILGNVTNSQVQQNNTLTVKNNDFESLKAYLQSNKVSEEDIQQLQTAIHADPRPTMPNSFGAKVSNWFGGMMSKAAANAWQIELAIASNLLTDALNNFYGLV